MKVQERQEQVHSYTSFMFQPTQEPLLHIEITGSQPTLSQVTELIILYIMYSTLEN